MVVRGGSQQRILLEETVVDGNFMLMAGKSTEVAELKMYRREAQNWE